jgi:hypothetical protein
MSRLRGGEGELGAVETGDEDVLVETAGSEIKLTSWRRQGCSRGRCRRRGIQLARSRFAMHERALQALRYMHVGNVRTQMDVCNHIRITKVSIKHQTSELNCIQSQCIKGYNPGIRIMYIKNACNSPTETQGDAMEINQNPIK